MGQLKVIDEVFANDTIKKCDLYLQKSVSVLLPSGISRVMLNKIEMRNQYKSYKERCEKESQHDPNYRNNRCVQLYDIRKGFEEKKIDW